MAEMVYLLCAGTSLLCAVLLIRSFLRTRSRLLLWSSLCFVGLALNNLMAPLDLVAFPETDLTQLRSIFALLGILTLIGGLVWESR